MELKERNYAGDHVVVGSLDVLGDLNSKGLKSVRRDVKLLQNTQLNINSKIDSYWADLSADGVITPVEKKALKKEWEGIAQSYAALYQEASQKQLLNQPYWIDYQEAYDALKKCIFTDEKLFDLMESTTVLQDKDAFDEYFEEYYYAQQFINLAITTGLIDKLGLRALTSLEEEGTNGELAFYRGELYQYVEDTWVKIGTQTYLGIVNQMSDLPTEKQEGQYFLAGQVFTVKCELQVNSKILKVNNKILMVKYLEFTEAGTILYWSNDRWNIADEDDPRYIAVMADYITVTGGLPALLVNELQQVLPQIIPPNPQYLGVFSTAPSYPNKGDYFLYSGINVGNWHKARIYRYTGTQWEELDPDDDGLSDYYMNALQDILILEAAGDGYFSTIFCNAFFSNKASINALKVQTIYLKNNGNIQSEQTTYTAGVTGLKIDANGNIDANGSVHIKGPCAIGTSLSNVGTHNVVIEGDVKIGGDTTFSGTIDTEKECYAAGFVLKGLRPGNKLLRIISVENETQYWQIPASGTVRISGQAHIAAGIEIGNGDINIYKNGTLMYNEHYVEAGGRIHNISYDLTVEAGDTIGVQAYSVGGGASGPDPIIFQGGIYTATVNTLVSFLGRDVTIPNPPSPAR